MQRLITRTTLALSLAIGFLPQAATPSLAQAINPAAVADYRTRLARYEKARESYEAVAAPYWDQISDKRRIRIARRRDKLAITLDDYVLTQPPLYDGPSRPVNPEAPNAPPPEAAPPIPLVADFLAAAADQFQFVPNRPQNEADFKRAYARTAMAEGLTREQAVGVYAFETGGNGTYDMQSGVSATRPNAISPALGYNQLLSTNTLSLLAEFGDRYIAALRMKALPLRGEARRSMDHKVDALRRMVAYSRTVPQRWADQDNLAKKTRGGWGVHAAVLDIDIGPMLQVQKLVTSVHFARMKGYMTPLTPAELELMNLTGDGNGFDMVSMPHEIRDRVPTSNFFQRNGYERNPVARRTGTVAGLIADMEKNMARSSQTPGAKDLAAAFN